MQAELVLLGEDDDRALAHLVGRAHHPDGDLAPVGDQNFLEARHQVAIRRGGVEVIRAMQGKGRVALGLGSSGPGVDVQASQPHLPDATGFGRPLLRNGGLVPQVLP